MNEISSQNKVNTLDLFLSLSGKRRKIKKKRISKKNWTTLQMHQTIQREVMMFYNLPKLKWHSKSNRRKYRKREFSRKLPWLINSGWKSSIGIWTIWLNTLIFPKSVGLNRCYGMDVFDVCIICTYIVWYHLVSIFIVS